MNYKRRRCKNRRAGCLYCKPHKANGNPRWGKQSLSKSDGRKRAAITEDMKEDLAERGNG